MSRKILKYEYNPQGTDKCNPRKCWDKLRTLDMLVGVIFPMYSLLAVYDELVSNFFFLYNFSKVLMYFYTFYRSVVSPPLLWSVNGQWILTQQKSWSLLPPWPRNAIPESIASHSSLFPSLSFSLSLSLSLWPISGDSSSCRRRPKTEEEAIAEEIPNTKHTCWPPDIF